MTKCKRRSGKTNNRIAEIQQQCEKRNTTNPIIFKNNLATVDVVRALMEEIASCNEDVAYLLAQLAERDNEIESLQAETKVTGETSDGYHTFNELYHHRAMLFSVICNDRLDRAWKSKLHHDGTMYDGMFIVGIQTPNGQATYHYDIDPYWDMFRVPELSQAPKWDGHTPAQAIERIGRLTQPENKPLTNADRIRSTTDEELAEFLEGEYGNFETGCALDWLKQPVKEE